MGIIESGRRNIVILGAGFGGITALLKLRRGLKRYGLLNRYRLVLVNRTSHHLYTPALYEIAAIPKDQADAVRLETAICIPIENIIGRFPEIRFIGETAVGLDPERHLITLASGSRLSFEYLIVALGAETNFFGIPGMAEHALPIKTFGDALRLRNRVEGLVRETAGALRIVVGGGGATGVELAAELVNCLRYLRERAAAGERRAEITLVEASPEILPGFDPDIVRRARRRLSAIGVRVITGAAIREVRPSEAVLDGATLPYGLLIWAGGVRPAARLSGLGLTLDPRGGVVVNEFLEARPETGASAARITLASGRIYAIGDNASFPHPKTGALLPGNVPVAEAGARLAAKNIIAGITGRRRQSFRPPARYPFILAVGGRYALTDLVVVKLFGFAGWALKQLVELRYLLSILPWPKAIALWARTVFYTTRND